MHSHRFTHNAIHAMREAVREGKVVTFSTTTTMTFTTTRTNIHDLRAYGNEFLSLSRVKAQKFNKDSKP